MCNICKPPCPAFFLCFWIDMRAQHRTPPCRIDELSRCGSGGVLWGLFGGLSIGTPSKLVVVACNLTPACLRGSASAV